MFVAHSPERDTFSSSEPVTVGDVCFKRDGVYAMELGGPEVGRGCGGRGIIHGFELLEKGMSRPMLQMGGRC